MTTASNATHAVTTASNGWPCGCDPFACGYAVEPWKGTERFARFFCRCHGKPIVERIVMQCATHGTCAVDRVQVEFVAPRKLRRRR